MVSLAARDASAAAPVHARAGRWLVPAVVAAAAAVSVPALTSMAGPVTSYAAASPITLMATLATAIALMTAGGLAWWQGGTSTAGTAVLVAATAWLAPVWVGWSGGPPMLRSLGLVVAPFSVAPLVQLTLSGPDGTFRNRATLLAGSAVWVVTAMFSLFLVAIRDPLLDLTCWSDCTDNLFLVHPWPDLARDASTAWLWVVVLAGAASVGDVVVRLARAEGRSWVWLVPLPAAMAAAAGAVYTAVLLFGPAENPDVAPYGTVFLIRGATLILLAAGTTWWVMRARTATAALARLAGELGAAPEPGTLQAWLARTWGDPGLRVAYRSADHGQYLDAAGRQTSAAPAPGQDVTTIVRAGEPVAVVLHRRVRPRGDPVGEQLGPAARLAIDNERLSAQVLAQLAELRESRARIVASGDAARRAWERDLHDGAQQRLLAAIYQLRAAAPGAPDRTALDGLADEAVAAAGELRELAHGIFPAIIDEAGLEPALQTLADQTPAPVEVTVTGDPPPAAARAGYLLVAAAISRKYDTPRDRLPAAAAVTVRAAVEASVLHLVVEGAAAVDYTHCADRIGALGGRLVVDGRILRAEIPCG
jgi:signal transduction histidine kinase